MYKTHIATGLKNIRNNLNLTFTKVEEVSGITRKTISEFENKHDNISLENIVKLMNCYGIEIDFEETMKIIGSKLLELRKDRDLSLSQVGDLCGSSHSKVSELESGLGNVTIDYLIRISKGLGISPFVLYQFSELDTSLFNISEYHVEYDGPELDMSRFDVEYDDNKSNKEAAAKVVNLWSVVDGDTVKADIEGSKRIRMLVIDTPETFKKVGRWGIVAKEYIEYLISKSEEVVLQQDVHSEARDYFGRALAWVWIKIDGKYQLLNYILVKAGFATVKHVMSEDTLYLDELRKAEQDAKDNKRVMWGYKYLDPYWDYETNKPKQKFYIVKCDDNYVHITNYAFDDITFVKEKEATKFRNDFDAKIIKRKVKLFDKFDIVNIREIY